MGLFVKTGPIFFPLLAEKKNCFCSGFNPVRSFPVKKLQPKNLQSKNRLLGHSTTKKIRQKVHPKKSGKSLSAPGLLRYAKNGGLFVTPAWTAKCRMVKKAIKMPVKIRKKNRPFFIPFLPLFSHT